MIGRDDVFRVQRRPPASFHVEHCVPHGRDSSGRVVTHKRCCSVDVELTDADRQDAESTQAAEVAALFRADRLLNERHR